MGTPNLASVVWRKSTFSGGNGQCVEVAVLGDNAVAVRNSKHPDAGTVIVPVAVMAALVQGIKAGEFDDLAP